MFLVARRSSPAFVLRRVMSAACGTTTLPAGASGLLLLLPAEPAARPRGSFARFLTTSASTTRPPVKPGHALAEPGIAQANKAVELAEKDVAFWTNKVQELFEKRDFGVAFDKAVEQQKIAIAALDSANAALKDEKDRLKRAQQALQPPATPQLAYQLPRERLLQHFPNNIRGDDDWGKFLRCNPEPAKPEQAWLQAIMTATLEQVDASSPQTPQPGKILWSRHVLDPSFINESRDNPAAKHVDIITLPLPAPMYRGEDNFDHHLYVRDDDLGLIRNVRSTGDAPVSCVIGNPGVGKSWFQFV